MNTEVSRRAVLIWGGCSIVFLGSPGIPAAAGRKSAREMAAEVERFLLGTAPTEAGGSEAN